MAFCTKCGASIPEGARFCGICGAPLGGTSPTRRVQPQQQPQQPQQQYGGYQPQPQQYGGYQPQQAQQQYGGYQQQPRQQYGYQPQQQPQYGGYQQPANSSWAAYNGYGAAARRKPASSRRGLLRILSVIFAVGLLITCAGVSGMIYYNRQVGSAVEESYQGYFDSLQKAKDSGWMTEEEVKEQTETLRKQLNAAKRSGWKILGPTLRCDVKGVMRAAVSDISDYDLTDYTSEQKEELRKRLENEKESVEELIKNLSDEDFRNRREEMAEDNREGIEKAGFRYLWLIISAYNSIFMIAGGALALIALIAWIILGGLRGPVSETAVVPAVIVCATLGAILIVVFGLLISPIKTEEMK